MTIHEELDFFAVFEELPGQGRDGPSSVIGVHSGKFGDMVAQNHNSQHRCLNTLSQVFLNQGEKKSNPSRITQMSEDLKKRINERFVALNLNPTSAAKKVGKSKDLFVNLLRGSVKHPTTRTLQLMADALDTSSEWLLNGNGSNSVARSNARPAVGLDTSFLDEESMNSNRQTPILGSAAGSLSTGAIEFSGDTNSGYAINLPQLEGVPGVYALYVIGDSMVPALEPGNLVYINPNLPASTGDIVVVQLNVPGEPTSEAFIKRFQSVSKEEVTVSQENPPQTIVYPQFSGDDDEKFVKSVHKVVAIFIS
ncbi:MAG: hypothetical protein JKY96_01480 [Phycisphaerales bacterium]|nr:hypothetical protein [Phycisphaerales bacterium]